MDKDNNFFNNLQAKKIQHCYFLYNFRKKLSKFRKMELTVLGQSLPFDEFSKVIRKKNILDTSLELIKSIRTKDKLKLSSRILLTIYLINFYSEELLGKESERYPIDNNICQWTKKIINQLEMAEYKKYHDLVQLWKLLHNYKLFFNNWKKIDNDRTIERIIISYHYRCEHIKKIDEHEIDNDTKLKILIKLEDEKTNLLKNIKMIDPNINIEFIKKNHDELHNNILIGRQKLTTSLGNNMKKAYYDMVSEELKKRNMKPTYDMLIEINKRVLLIVPEKRKKSLMKKLNQNSIIECLTFEWNDNIIEYLNMIIDLIIMLSAPIDDSTNLQWKHEFIQLCNQDYEENLPKILIQIEEKLDRIYQQILDLDNQS